MGVASIALHHGADEDEAIAALLHDAIEDARADLGAAWVRSWLRFRFGDRVRSIVEGCTDADVVPKPAWRQRGLWPRLRSFISRAVDRQSSRVPADAS